MFAARSLLDFPRSIELFRTSLRALLTLGGSLSPPLLRNAPASEVKNDDDDDGDADDERRAFDVDDEDAEDEEAGADRKEDDEGTAIEAEAVLPLDDDGALGA